MELADILDSVAGPKCLVLDPCLGGPLNLVVTEGQKCFKPMALKISLNLGGESLIQRRTELCMLCDQG